jgi:hypothetical protein
MPRNFAENFTGRVRLKYRTFGFDHEAMLRGHRSMNAEEADGIANKLAALINIFDDERWPDWVVLGWEYCLAASTLWVPFVPTDAAIALGTANPTGRSGSRAATMLRWIGRSVGGSPWSLSLFGLAYDTRTVQGEDFRLTGAESAPIGTFITGLTEIAPELVGIDDEIVVPKLYANIKDNDAIVKKLRQV